MLRIFLGFHFHVTSHTDLNPFFEAVPLSMISNLALCKQCPRWILQIHFASCPLEMQLERLKDTSHFICIQWFSLFSSLLSPSNFLKIFYLLIYFRERVHVHGSMSRGRSRGQWKGSGKNLEQTPHWALRLAWGSGSGPRDHGRAETKSWQLNQLSYPGTWLLIIL